MELFNWEHYVKNYSDLHFITTEQHALAHWNRYGNYENRINYVIYFDIFMKNGYIYIILPMYTDICLDDLTISYNDAILPIEYSIIKNKWEPVHINKYKFNSKKENVEITINYKSIKNKVILENKLTIVNKTLALSTLFKDDHKLIPIFYDYYKKQGVEHFYLYYNGKLTKLIKDYFKDLKDVTLIEWNYLYHSKFTKYSPHFAQTAQIHHSIYKYGKESCKYMIFCDLDEYLFCKDTILIDYIKLNKGIDTFGFKQILAKTNYFPKIFPSSFYTTDASFQYSVINGVTPSSKCIHKMETCDTVSIHFHDNENNKLDISNYFYHFFNWSQPGRTKDYVFKLLFLK